MFLGIDLGTSAVKVILLNHQDEIVAQASSALTVFRPHSGWSEQDPEAWWRAACNAVQELKINNDLSLVEAIGLSGQMHGATLLDNCLKSLRPAILWNDSRSAEECIELEAITSDFLNLGGNRVMPGFTAPKLKWVQRHEPDVFANTHKVLLPKDYLNLKLTGECVSDMSDSAGTLWMDIARRDWSDSMLNACSLSREHMPRLYEGCQVTGNLRQELADLWGMKAVPVVAGAGDNAAGAVGVGVTRPGQAMLSLGTSGVFFVVTDGYRSNPEQAVHSFCHALPDTWHLMSVMLSAACCLDWFATVSGVESVGSLIEEAEQSGRFHPNLIFLPYLSGERTPHNNPNARGVFFGLDHGTTRADMALAVLEGISMGLNDGYQALIKAGAVIDDVTLIGGGARSPFWRQLLANILQKPLSYRAGSEVGPALGAARLARLGVQPASSTSLVSDICPVPEMTQVHSPDADVANQYQKKYEKFRTIYHALENVF
ncbi:xylulokinase [Sansalvadorimonas sp. 2012CJ34-2]|uniref:Xylulose kinase n=1 Tax=Parendozoicomonas callyspongiae TaxID=2942213 RepID=A0ABT0PMC7_9GAMM|nr:xylulokinase [Sansalvadorimonas sp. 2012CJ34-2]MCL6271897.1 xylulokinase [Sansalvadorimonas sp. 2012CJ34-2]